MLIIPEIAKYIIAVLMIAYTAESFILLRDNIERKAFSNERISFENKKGYLRQIIYMLGIHFAGFISLISVRFELRYILLYLGQFIFMGMYLYLFPKAYKSYSKLILNHMSLLLIIGFIILARLHFDRSLRQFLIIAPVMILCLFIPKLFVSNKNIRRFAWGFGIAGIGAFIIVLLTATVIYGSRRTISIFGIGFQPSEFVKLTYILLIACILSGLKKYPPLIISSVFATIHVLLLAISRDLGMALIYTVAFIAMIYLYTRKHSLMGIGLVLAVIASVIAYRIFPHVGRRVEAWMDLFSNPDTSGFQILQSLFALGTGSWFGMGVGQGRPNSIPLVEADFVFSAIGEEFGIIFCICLILVYLNCIWAFFMVALKLREKFYRLTVIGLGTAFGMQVFLVIGGGIKFIPLTGITLPLISHGSSSAIAILLMFSLLQSLCDRHELLEEKVHKKKKISMLTRQVILNMAYFFSLILILTAGYLLKFTIFEAKNVINSTYNPRSALLAEKTKRGSIFAAGGEVLAETVTDASGAELRFYPYQKMFAHVVGYATKARQGIEARENFKMLTSSQPFYVKLGNLAKSEKHIGDNIITTLDYQLQKTAYDALGDMNGAIVVMEIKTGKILAMVSKPDFDPNEIDSTWDILNASDDGIFINRATQGLYPPGSTFKIITALEYSRQNPDDFLEFDFHCSGTINVGVQVVNCFNEIAHGQVDFFSAFSLSCNSAFVKMAEGLDKELFQDTADMLLFNETLPTFIPVSMSLVDIERNPDGLIQTAIGQGSTLVTPLHLTIITAAIANDGMPAAPYLIEANSSKQKSLKPLITENEAALLVEAMEAGVRDGTGKRLQGEGYVAAGKTGSAEFSTRDESHAWFTGFAPVDDPQIVVTVIIEGGGSGGLVAVPVVKQVFDAYFH